MRLSDRLKGPCDQRWADLVPRGEGRYCGLCDTVVIDLSRLTRREALERTRGGACVRARLDEHGEPIFRPDSARRTGLSVLAVAAALTGCGSSDATRPDEPVLAAEPSIERAVEAPLEPLASIPEVQLAPVQLALDEAQHASDEEAVPTPEQIALTRRKRERRARAAQTPTIAATSAPRYHFLGGMIPE